ncbi:MAG: hypothetical protein R3C58_04895 [Parvularculaceae bacterium]
MGRQKNEAPRASADRLASIAGGASTRSFAQAHAAPASAPRQVLLEPDLSRIRPRGIEETPDQRKRRLAAKTINFSMTFIARIVIMAAVGLLAWDIYQRTGAIHRGIAVGMFAMVADFGRVLLKCMEPGTK